MFYFLFRFSPLVNRAELEPPIQAKACALRFVRNLALKRYISNQVADICIHGYLFYYFRFIAGNVTVNKKNITYDIEIIKAVISVQMCSTNAVVFITRTKSS